jgi:hypothetical protein
MVTLLVMSQVVLWENAGIDHQIQHLVHLNLSPLCEAEGYHIKYQFTGGWRNCYLWQLISTPVTGSVMIPIPE